MKRKRNNLDTSEANYLYAQVILALNKNKKFNDLSIPERNNLIDKICIECINLANSDEDDKEALILEIQSYKQSDEEKRNFYDSNVYENNLEKPEDFNDKMKKKYDEIIKKTIKEFAQED